MIRLTNLLILLLLLSGCAMLDNRDFAEQMDPMRVDDPLFVPNQHFSVVTGDDGRYYRDDSQIKGRTPATQRGQQEDLYTNSIKRELRGLESKMNDAEYQEYLRIRDQLGSDSEKIYYLRLRNSEKQEYLGIKRIETPRYYTVRESKLATFGREIVLGMNKNDVLSSWGHPDRKDVSGDPRYQNERWAYSRNGVVKYIYFQGGHVGGWTQQ